MERAATVLSERERELELPSKTAFFFQLRQVIA